MPEAGIKIVDVTMGEELILLCLTVRELYGAEIVKKLELASNGRRSFKPGSLYRILHSLEEKGLVESRRCGSDDYRPGGTRSYYKLTPDGERAVLRAKGFYARLEMDLPR